MPTSKRSQEFHQLSETSLERLWRQLRLFDRKWRLSDLMVCLVISSLLVLLLQHEFGTQSFPVYTEGQIAQRTVRVNRIMEVQDKRATEAARAQILGQVPDVYDYESGAVESWVERWRQSVRTLRLRAPQLRDRAQAASQFSELLGVPVNTEEMEALWSLRMNADLERSAAFSLGPFQGLRIAEHRPPPEKRSFKVKDTRTQDAQFLESEALGDVLGLDEARSLVGRMQQRRGGFYRIPWAKWSPTAREAVFAIQARMLRPNLTLNLKDTEEKRSVALKDFRPVVQLLAKGEVIVREGERVSPRAAMLLAELNQRSQERGSLGDLPAQMIFWGMSLWFLSIFLRRMYPRVLNRKRDNLVALGMLLLSMATFRLVLVFEMDVMADRFPMLPAAFFLFLIPVAAPAMMLRLLIRPQVTIVFSILHGLGVSLLLDKASLFGVHVVMCSLAGIWFLGNCRTRNQLYRAGLQSAVVGGLSAAVLLLAWGGQLPLSTQLVGDVSGQSQFGIGETAFWAALGAMIGGWLSSAMVMAVTPPLESLLGYTTDLKLLELARMDHPLLREMVMKAPGTYHHSMVVGSLAEAGADAIRANALLARVGSYYHDIGKMERPQYFVENQAQGINPHDQTSAHMSAKIILAHVKHGVTLAQQYKLGQPIIDFIEQHHGTGTVAYFYNKAKQNAAKPTGGVEMERVDQEEFRYGGPKPQTPETAIVSLADSVEAATRSLVDPTPARIEGMVAKIINNALNEGVLDEADISLRQVRQVGKAFVRILLGIHHHRIQYPDQEKGLPSRAATSSTSTLTLIKKNDQ